MSELPKPPESQPPTSSDDWEDKKMPHTNRPVPKSWKWMLAISLVLTVCSSGVAVKMYLDKGELATKLASKDTLITLRGTDTGWVFGVEADPSVTEFPIIHFPTHGKLITIAASQSEKFPSLVGAGAGAFAAMGCLGLPFFCYNERESIPSVTVLQSKVAELERQLELTKTEANEAKQKLASVMKDVQSKVAELEQQLASVIKGVQSKVAELEQQLTLAESSLKEQQLQFAKTSLNDAAKSTQEIKQQLRLLAEKGKGIGLKQAVTQ